MAMAEKEVRPKPVLCTRDRCVHCIPVDKPVPIEELKGPGYTPPYPIVFTHKCDRKAIALDKNSNCVFFRDYHPDKMYAAVITRKRNPTTKELGMPDTVLPTVGDRIREGLKSEVSDYKYHPQIESLLEEIYWLGRSDEKFGQKLDTDKGHITIKVKK
jgi:hypothetical protein